MNVINFSDLRKNMKEVMEGVCDRHEPTIITRQKGNPLILMSLADYNALEETAYLMRNPNNYKHILESIGEVKEEKITRHDLIAP
jgi:antitoxin YefM